MQRFVFSRRPLSALGLAVCLVGSVLLPATHRDVVAQERPQPGQTTPNARPESTDPVLVVTVASLNKLMQDVNYITGVMGQPQAGGMFTMMAGTFTQGIDTTRPIAVLVPMVDGSPEPIGVLPSNNIELVLKRLEPQTGPADKLDDGTLVIAAGPALVYIRQVGNWAVVARNRELIDLVPADPMSLMEGLGDNYDIGLRLNIQEIPLQLREMLVEQLSQGFEQAMARQQGGDLNSSKLSQMQLEQLNTLIREAEQLKFGLNINPNKRIISIDTEFTAAEGTSLAEMYAGTQPIASKFSAVLSGDAALRYHVASSVSPEAVRTTTESTAAIKEAVQNALAQQDELEDHQRAEIEEMLDGLIEIGVKTLQEGKMDAGVIGRADDQSFQIVGGSFVHDGNAVAAWVKELAAKLRDAGDAPQFNFDESQYNGVTMHSIVFDIPADQAELRRTFGEQAKIQLGTGPQAVYFALGQGSADAMQKLIDSADADRGDLSERPLGQARVKLLPILRLIQSIKPNDSLAAVIDSVALGGDNDYLSIVTHAIENGQSSNVEIGEGLIKAAGAAVREAQMQQMQQMQQRGGGQF